jgi:hypothetical protein
MARQCFCGCGQTIPFYMFGLRAYNTHGRRVRRLMESAEEAIEHPDEPTCLWLAEGRETMRMLGEVVHQERDPRTVSDSDIREWRGQARAAQQEHTRRIGG